VDKIIAQESSAGTFTQLTFGQSFMVGDVQHGWQVVELWSDEDLADIGIYRVALAIPPADEEIVSASIERVDGVVTQVLVTQPITPPPLKASARQIRLAMNMLGLRDGIEEYVASQSRDVQDSWQWTTEFESNHPFVVGAAEHLNKSDEELKALFLLAQTF
jgi:hypothetical protein